MLMRLKISNSIREKVWRRGRSLERQYGGGGGAREAANLSFGLVLQEFSLVSVLQLEKELACPLLYCGC